MLEWDQVGPPRSLGPRSLVTGRNTRPKRAPLTGSLILSSLASLGRSGCVDEITNFHTPTRHPLARRDRWWKTSFFLLKIRTPNHPEIVGNTTMRALLINYECS